MDLNGYRIMWLFVFFDLPTDTKKDRKNASGFRNKLLKDGFRTKDIADASTPADKLLNTQAAGIELLKRI